jgi:hypothetical protein
VTLLFYFCLAFQYTKNVPSREVEWLCVTLADAKTQLGRDYLTLAADWADLFQDITHTEYCVW